MARRREAGRRGWPPNLYETDGYFRWRNPVDGKIHGLGRNKQLAFSEAVEANLYVAGLLNQTRLVDRLSGDSENTVAAWCKRYRAILSERKLAKATDQAFTRRLLTVEEKRGDRPLGNITTRDIADLLATWTDAGKKRMAQAVRSLLLDFFREAIAAGWIENNPVAPTRSPRIEVARARLTLEAFMAIYEQAKKMAPWVQRSMELALVAGQRREDLRDLGPRNLRDGKLWVTQHKTGALVCIPLDLRLHVVGWSVGEIIARCRDNIISKHLIHHNAHTGRAKPGDPIRLQSITGAFAEARDKAGITWPADKTPPTFHEIRSLAARLYDDQGTDAQALLGHKSPDMTAVYRDARGDDWIEVKTATN